jgi:hypothetical protein
VIFGVFVRYADMVPEPVAWFWEAVEEGRVPWSSAGVLGQYDADPGETPFILCPDSDERAKWAVALLHGARALP